MTRDKKVQTKLIRLGQILRIFMEKEKVSSAWLAEYFRTTPRTIQRDLLLLKESGFPLHEEKKGTYRLSRDLVKNLEVTVLIDNKVSHYFKRRKMFPTQEIKEERPDGSIIVTFRVGYHEAIRNILKSWIPNIIILEPEELKLSMIEDVQGWLKQQNIAG